ncbi:hypothetical protein KDL01_39005 [Actinospica durhamensis]|uniref:Secreted protein n=1 Tax=Actinospica durhamensis TaxID=1508375 RepID=A0A941EW20_9ACTN|nr:hypothetical protein [Actinospica durhamensis]MBR7839315.1 hypothetical protein [Actinospica durhamensis]
MRNRFATALATAAATLLTAALPGAAQADSTSGSSGGSGGSGGWQTYTNANYLIPAGTACTFGVQNDVVQQDEQYRVVSTYPDGTPLETDWRGPLVVSYTNVNTGKSIIEDLSGTAQFYASPDGSGTWVSQDHFGLTIAPGNPYHAAGLYVLTGPAVFTVSAAGTVDILAQDQSADICRALS